MGRSPTALVVSDLNRDGHVDLAVANNDGDSVSLLFGSGPGNFLAAVAVPVGAGPSAIGTADLNGDLRPDLMVSSGVDDVLMSMISVAPRSVELGTQFDSGTGPSGLAMPDLDRDGRADLVVSNSFDGTISVFLGDAQGGFVSLGDLVTGAGFDSGPLGVSAGDFNRDGLADVVAVNEGSDTVVVLVGDGHGDIATRISLDTGGFPESLTLRDLNGDGLAEIVTADSFSDVVSVFPSIGGGAFDDRVVFPVGRSPFDVVVGDFNDDGRPDLATANLDDDTVSILLNNTAYAVAHGDVNGDVVVDAGDIEAALSELFDGDGDLTVLVERGLRPSAATADGNLDGFVSAADVLAVEREMARGHHPRAAVDLRAAGVLTLGASVAGARGE